MAHAQKPDFVFRRNGRVHLNRRGRQFSRLLAAEVCASAVVILDTPCEEYWLPTPFARFPFTSPPVLHGVSSHFNWTLLTRPRRSVSSTCLNSDGFTVQKRSKSTAGSLFDYQFIHTAIDIKQRCSKCQRKDQRNFP
jgi:hypothetical protein